MNWGLIIIISSICYGDRARLVNGSVSQFCSDHSLPELFRVLQCRWYRLVEACQQLSQLRGYLALECQEGGCFAFLLQSSCSTWIWERWAWNLLSTWVQCIRLKRKVICYQLELRNNFINVSTECFADVTKYCYMIGLHCTVQQDMACMRMQFTRPFPVFCRNGSGLWDYTQPTEEGLRTWWHKCWLAPEFENTQWDHSVFSASERVLQSYHGAWGWALLQAPRILVPFWYV